MEQRGNHRVRGVRRVWHVAGLLIVVLGLAGCSPDGQGISAAQPRGATVAFDSLDGLPPVQFQRLVKDLNDEAQSRRLAVISREQPSAYRVRGYLAATVTKAPDIGFLGLGRVRPGRAPRLAYHWRGNRKGQAKGRLGGRRRSHAAPDCAIEHGAACRIPDIARGRTRHGTGLGRRFGERKRVLARGSRYFPYFPPPSRPDIDGERASRGGGGDISSAAPAATSVRAPVVEGNAYSRCFPP